LDFRFWILDFGFWIDFGLILDWYGLIIGLARNFGAAIR
jgi:hypothetical protein